MRRLLVLCLIAACDGTPFAERPSQYERLGTLGLEVPAEWTRGDATPLGQVSSTWVPSAENPRKESVTVIRSQVDHAFVRADGAYLEQMLRAAQATLPKARLSSPTAVTTAQGLSGLRMTVDYVPAGQRAAYHRVHVVLVDRTATSALIHVLYTARDADPELAALELVLSTLRPEEG